MEEFITKNGNTIIVYTVNGLDIITTLYDEENILCTMYNTDNEVILIFTLWLVNERYNYKVLKNVKKVSYNFIEQVVDKLVNKIIEV